MSVRDFKVRPTVNGTNVPVSTEVMGIVNHGSTASTARPTGFAAIMWIGSVTPTNAIDGDVWIDTA